jgi:hypothetical protein
MKLSNTEKILWVVILTILLTVLLSNIVYTRYLNKEGGFFDAIGKIFSMIGKIFQILSMIGDFFCWMGDAVRWMVDTVAAIFYYIGNIFSGCVLFYAFDMFVGTMWYILYIGASIIGGAEYYTEGSGQLDNFRITFDDYFYETLGVHIFKYSDETKEKCYKLKFKPFPEWPF